MVIKMERIQKVIAKAGICSRRKAEELLLAGRVKVNGEVCTTLGTMVDETFDIEVDGVSLSKSEGCTCVVRSLHL